MWWLNHLFEKKNADQHGNIPSFPGETEQKLFPNSFQSRIGSKDDSNHWMVRSSWLPYIHLVKATSLRQIMILATHFHPKWLTYHLQKTVFQPLFSGYYVIIISFMR